MLGVAALQQVRALSPEAVIPELSHVVLRVQALQTLGPSWSQFVHPLRNY